VAKPGVVQAMGAVSMLSFGLLDPTIKGRGRGDGMVVRPTTVVPLDLSAGGGRSRKCQGQVTEEKDGRAEQEG
jgi:hypothetical protein